VECFYYCDYTDKRSLEPPNAFGTLARQLLNNVDPLPESLLVEIEQAEHDGEQLATTEIAVEILQSVIKIHASSTTPVYILVDGIDEMAEKSQECILRSLKKILTIPDIVVKLFVTSREDLKPHFATGAEISISAISMTDDTIGLDISAFVKSSVRKRILEGTIVVQDPGLEHLVTDSLIQGARGM
jgi:hypothetical protein